MSKMKLHPAQRNYTVVLIDELQSGRVPDFARCTGRSTAQALKLIASAINAPYMWHAVCDHHKSREADGHLVGLIREIVDKLGLVGFQYKALAIACGMPDEPGQAPEMPGSGAR